MTRSAIGLSIRPDAALRAASDSDTTKLSNSVWVRTYGNQYNVKNAYGDGYTRTRTASLVVPIPWTSAVALG
jgi:hypothetical protein